MENFLVGTLRAKSRAFFQTKSGATLVEYGKAITLAIVLAIVLGGGAFALLAGEISVSIGSTAAAIPN